MKKYIIAVLILLLAIPLFSQEPRPDRTPRWDKNVRWILTGQETLTYKTLSGVLGLTVGADGTGYDVYFYGDVSGCYFQWDDDNDMANIVVTSATTTGTDRALSISFTQTGGSYTKIIEALRVEIDAAVMTGDWVNAIVSRIDYASGGTAGGGMAAALCSELALPPSSAPAGSYYALDLEFQAQANYVAVDGTGHNVAYLRFGLYDDGTAVASFEDESYFMHISTDFTDASGNMWYDNTLRILIETTDWFIPLSSAEGEYESAYLIDITNTTGSTSITTGSIQTDGGIGAVKSVFVGRNLDVDGVTNLDSVDIDQSFVMDGTMFDVNSTTTVTIDNTNTGNGVVINAVTSGSPISIGHTTSETTVNDNLSVTGDLAVELIANLDNTDIDGTFTMDGTAFDVNSTTTVTIDNTNTGNGVVINAVTSGGVVSIGHTTSETTVNDNLTVSGDEDVVGAATAGSYASDATVSGTTITASVGFALGDTDYAGITDNERFTFQTAGTIKALLAHFIIGEDTPDEHEPYLSIRADADSDDAGDTTDELKIAITANATPTSATWGFTSTQSAGYTFDKAVDVTGLLTSSVGLALGDGDYVGVTSNEVITFATGGIVAVEAANFVVGASGTPDELEPYLAIRADADSDADDTLDEFKIFLTANATPTLATWGFTSTQSAGYTFDKWVEITGGLDLAAATTGIDITGAMTTAIDVGANLVIPQLLTGGTSGNGIHWDGVAEHIMYYAEAIDATMSNKTFAKLQLNAISGEATTSGRLEGFRMTVASSSTHNVTADIRGVVGQIEFSGIMTYASASAADYSGAYGMIASIWSGSNVTSSNGRLYPLGIFFGLETGTTLSGEDSYIYIYNYGKVCPNSVIKLYNMSTPENPVYFFDHQNIVLGSASGPAYVGDIAPDHAPDGSSIGADGHLKILLGATPYYIPIYNSLE